MTVSEEFEMESYHHCDTDLQWYGLYQNDQKYRKYLSDETNAHPAKMSMRLADFILMHLEHLNLIHQGDRIIDFMAGTARTGVVAELHGYPFTGIELESHFIDMIKGYECDGKEESKDTERQYGSCGKPQTHKPHTQLTLTGEKIECDGKEHEVEVTYYGKCRKQKEIHAPHYVDGNQQTVSKGLQRNADWNIIQGDARHLSEILKENGIGITSPVYGGMTPVQIKAGMGKNISEHPEKLNERFRSQGYSAITSPTYGNIEIGKGLNTKPPRDGHNDQSGRSPKAPSQIATKYRAIISPAYGQAEDRNRYKTQEGNVTEVMGRQYDKSNHGTSEGQIGNLKDSGLFTLVSPPHGLGEGLGHSDKDNQLRIDKRLANDRVRYGKTEGQIGNLKDAGLVSPTYINMKAHPSLGNPNSPANKGKWGTVKIDHLMKDRNLEYRFGDTEGQIGNLKDAGLFSPPYENSLHKGSGTGKAPEEKKVNLTAYSDNKQNIGNLKDAGVVSPPYGEAHAEVTKENNGVLTKNRDDLIPYSYAKGNATKSEENIGNLKDGGIVSPPYEESLNANHRSSYSREPSKFQKEKNLPRAYSTNNENIGNSGESYLQAMLQVYSEAFKSGISPLVTVTKNPTKNHQLRRLDIDTAKLLEMAGYVIIDYHQAVLFDEHTEKALNGEEHKTAKGQLSFFKRLSLQNGNVAADHEDIIIAVIP